MINFVLDVQGLFGSTLRMGLSEYRFPFIPCPGLPDWWNMRPCAARDCRFLHTSLLQALLTLDLIDSRRRCWPCVFVIWLEWPLQSRRGRCHRVEWDALKVCSGFYHTYAVLDLVVVM